MNLDDWYTIMIIMNKKLTLPVLKRGLFRKDIPVSWFIAPADLPKPNTNLINVTEKKWT